MLTPMNLLQKGTKNALNRPLPGILDFTCQYKGGLFAIREAKQSIG